MPKAPMTTARPIANPARHIQVGCVSFLNAKPLIDGLVLQPHQHLQLDVPSALLAGLESGQTDIALCPVIDFQRSKVPLVVVPVGGIGCDGPTLTVRLLVRYPCMKSSSCMWIPIVTPAWLWCGCCSPSCIRINPN
ncbi:MAG: hypothetical protein HC898_04780 [Phycisphaerales bacterium]|nr:hypothetical protein [Phycisphaerales bacterium]